MKRGLLARDEKIVNAASTFLRGWGKDRSKTSGRLAPVMGESQWLEPINLKVHLKDVIVRLCHKKGEKGDHEREMLSC